MHLVPKPDWLDRIDRAVWKIPCLRLFIFVMLLRDCVLRGDWLLGVLLGFFALYFIADEFLPHLLSKKSAPE